MQVKEIMSREIISLSPSDSVANLISLMEKHHVHEIFVIENKKLKGIVFSKSLITKGITDPNKAKISTLMESHPPTVSPEDDVEKAADMIFKTNLRAIPVLDGGECVGIVSVHDIVDFASGMKIFRQTAAEQIMSIPETITEDTDIGKARVLMREKNISHLPVVDTEGKLKGIVTSFDMLKVIKQRERMGWMGMAAEMERIMGIPVSIIMNANPITSDKRTSLSEIVGLINRNRISGVVITENKSPVGIITVKDLLEFYISGLQQKGVYYQIIGLGDEDSFVLDTVDRMVEDSIKKLSKMFKPRFFFLHVKRQFDVGLKNRIKYSVRVRFMTDKGMFISKAWKWDLRDAVGDALDNLERIVIKEKNATKDKLRKSLMQRKKI